MHSFLPDLPVTSLTVTGAFHHCLFALSLWCSSLGLSSAPMHVLSPLLSSFPLWYNFDYFPPHLVFPPRLVFLLPHCNADSCTANLHFPFYFCFYSFSSGTVKTTVTVSQFFPLLSHTLPLMSASSMLAIKTRSDLPDFIFYNELGAGAWGHTVWTFTVQMKERDERWTDRNYLSLMTSVHQVVINP